MEAHFLSIGDTSHRSGSVGGPQHDSGWMVATLPLYKDGVGARPGWPQQFLSTIFPQQDHVGGVLGTGDGEGFSIRRPLKFGDVFRSEVGDLVSGRAVERLHKNVIHALIANDVGLAAQQSGRANGLGESRSRSNSAGSHLL